jgi:SNF2 family DNA or RNA helicase
VFDGASNTEELHNKLVNHVMIGHKKREVLKDLPDKIRDIIPMELKNFDYYKKMEKEIKDLILHGERSLSLQRFEILKQVVYEEKKESCFQFIDDLLDIHDKILIFCNHTKVIRDIEERYGLDKVVKINGEVKVSDRLKIIKRFNTVKKVRIAALNTKAAGTGTDGLQDNCNVAVILELPWTPASIDQIEGRLERYGQKNIQFFYYLLGMHTAEMDILEILDKKLVQIYKSMEGKEVDSKDLLKELIKKFE